MYNKGFKITNGHFRFFNTSMNQINIFLWATATTMIYHPFELFPGDNQFL